MIEGAAYDIPGLCMIRAREAHAHPQEAAYRSVSAYILFPVYDTHRKHNNLSPSFCAEI